MKIVSLTVAALTAVASAQQLESDAVIYQGAFGTITEESKT